MALAGLLIAAIPALASARTAYVTGTDQFASGPSVSAVNLAGQAVDKEIALPGGGESGPGRVAIAPDGSRAYVTDGNTDQVIPIDVATNTTGTPIGVGFGPTSIAITPDGSRAYVTNTFAGTVTPIDLATSTALPTIAVGTLPLGIAITPDGSRAYVANLISNNVSVIALATNTVIATIPLTGSPSGVAVTPDGTRAYVTEGSGSTTPIDVATNTAGTPIAASEGSAIAITPDGKRAYTVTANGNSIPIDLAAASAAPAITVGGSPSDIAILPDGSRAYVPTSPGSTDQLVPIDLATDTALAGFPVGSHPEGIAIVPNQPPHAAFASAPAAPDPGSKVDFNGGGSFDPDNSSVPIARYDWNFGDGGSAANGGATPSHVYAKTGTYQVTLTTTDSEGCSTTFVFTGQTAYCNGSSVARVTHPVTVGNCPKVEGSATSFVPKLRSHHVVPGVRVRLAASAPAHLAIRATLLWSKEGENGRADLGKISVNINRWRRIRIPLPATLRERLPLGTPVKVSLRIHATPRGGNACAGAVTHPTLRVHVVKVIPGAVQSKRVR